MITKSELYEQDFQLWLITTIGQLEQGDFQALDVSHLVEELKELGKSDNNRPINVCQGIFFKSNSGTSRANSFVC